MSGWREMTRVAARAFSRGSASRGLAARGRPVRGVVARCSLAVAIVVMLCPGLSAAGVPPALALAATVGSSGMQADFSGELAGSLVYQQAAGASQALGILSGRLELRVDPVRSAAGFGSGPGGSSSGAPRSEERRVG